jgi:hypothetical protein
MKEGRYVKATDVDHIIPHRGDKKLFWNESNWQGPVSQPSQHQDGERGSDAGVSILIF